MESGATTTTLYTDEFSEDGKRRRQRYSEDARAVLENFFRYNPYPSPSERRSLAIRLNTTESSILYWFGHRRAKRPGEPAP